MAQKTKGGKEDEQELSPEQLKKHLDSLEERLDNIDSMLTAVVERVMKQPLSITLTCPNCGRIIEIGVVGKEKMIR